MTQIKQKMQSNKEEQKQFILNFIKKHKMAVLSTVSYDGKPQAAVLEFGESNDLEIIFDTLVSYRKYKNLQNNQHVAFVIGWDEDITVQYEGIANELSGSELENCKTLYFQKNPEAKRWETNPEIRYFKVKPSWIRYSDLNVKPWKILEINF